MKRKAGRKLQIGIAALALLAAVVGVTYAQLRYRETELEWYKSKLGNNQVRVLIPVGWRELDGGGGRGGEWRRLGPVSRTSWAPDWTPGWIRTFLEPKIDVRDRLELFGDNPVEFPSTFCEGFIDLHRQPRSYYANRQVHLDNYCLLKYGRANKRVFDAIYKRICDSLQIVP